MDELIASILDRVHALLDRSDPAPLLDDRAQVEIADLENAARATTDGIPPVQVASAVAWFHYARVLALPADDALEDLLAASEWFGFVAQVDPDLVPEAFRAPAPDDPNTWGQQGTELLGRAQRVDDPTALDEAIVLLRRTVGALPAGDPDRVGWLANLSLGLRLRGQRQDELADLDAAVAVAQEAVDTAGPDHGYRPACLSALGNALQVRFERQEAAADLDASIAALRAAVDLAPQDPMFLTNLGNSLRIRYDWSDDRTDLDDAIAMSEAALDASAADDPRRGSRMNNLGLNLATRGRRTDNGDDTDAAIRYLRAAVAAVPDGDVDWAGFRSNLGGALMDRYRRRHDIADIDEAIDVGTAAVAATGNDLRRAMFLANVGNNLRLRFERLDSLPDLNAAIADHEEALALTPVGHHDRPSRFSNLCLALRSRFERLGDRADGDGAVDAGRKAVDLAPAGHPARPQLLSGLGLAYLARFEQVGEPADIEAAVDAEREAVALIPLDHHRRPGLLSDLAGALVTRFFRFGAVSDLDDGIAFGRAAVADCPAGHPRRPVFLYNLSLALIERFKQGGELADLDGAIDTGRAAVAGTDTGDTELSKYLSGLSVTLLERFDVSGERADIDAAIDAGRDAVDRIPAGHPDRPIQLSMYATALHNRFKRLHEPSDVDAAIAAHRAAVDLTPAGHPDRPVLLTNLSAALRNRFTFRGAPADLDAAVDASQAAVDAVPANHPFRARYLYNAGLALDARFGRTCDEADARTALRLWREAAATGTAPIEVRADAARHWGEAAARQGWWAEAADGYAAAVGLLPLLAWVGAGRRSRERQLTEWAGLADDAAACAIAAGQPDRAIELLEQGRGVLWSQTLETRTDLGALRREHPGLADELDAVRAELDRPTDLPAHIGGSPAAAGVDARVAAARRWTTLLAEVRALAGFGDFARPPEVADLRRAATGGTIVVVNVSRWRSDALLVTDAGVDVRRLPDLTEEAAVEHVNEYLAGLQAFQASNGDPAVGAGMERAITATLGWLWDTVAEPVLRALRHDGTPAAGEPWPRVWWCPTRQLTIVPLHAAGRHDEAGCSVLDRVISSYTPTVRALAAARTRPRAGMAGRLLLIALPDTPGAGHLRYADQERAFVAGLFAGQPHEVLAGTAATRRGILGGLATHTWAHAACHGTQNMADPSTGGLVPYDWNTAGLVSVLDLARADSAHGEFAFLSACQTATGGIGSLDEAINLAAALHYAGWRRVIGTLWTVWDDAAFQITRDTYGRLVHDGTFDAAGAAEALHHAVRANRDQPGNRCQPSRWAPFLHTGP